MEVLKLSSIKLIIKHIICQLEIKRGGDRDVLQLTIKMGHVLCILGEWRTCCVQKQNMKYATSLLDTLSSQKGYSRFELLEDPTGIFL